ncbi:MAG: hypothetical protein GY868_14950 [Deltaproteobacteria bacterium]|nr:hypothetical protein [Deltaproteobacteria bacterium]
MKRLTSIISLAVFAFCMLSTSVMAADKDPFARYIRPVSNPVYAQDARNVTYFKIVHMHQKMPEYIDTVLGNVKLDGDFNVTAVQLGYAINERFSIVAEKTGYVDFDPDYTLDNENGWADYGAGIKYALIFNPEKQFILSTRVMVELTQGSREVFQGNGEGNVAASLTFLKGLGKWQFSGTAGAVLPIEGDHESMVVYDNWHVSYALTEKIRPLIELNHFAVIDEGDRDELVSSIINFEGGDLINTGSDHGKRNKHIVTLAAGFRFRCMKNLDIGMTYELPLTDKNDNLMRDRWTFDIVLHF